MTAQVIGVSGSPVDGGATDRVVGRIMEAAGLESELVRLWDIDVQPCKACLACAGSNICTGFDDDWLPLAVKLVRADALVVGGWAPFNILDARSKTLVERAFSLRHSILLNAGTVGVAVVTGTADPVPVADDVLAWFESEGLEPLGKVTPAGIDPCWSCGLGERCVVGGTVPLVRGEYELFWYPYKDRLPAPEGFVITPELVPPPPEEQPHVMAEAERLGRALGEAVRVRQAERTAALERALPGHASRAPLARLRVLLAAAGEASVGGDGTLDTLLETAERQAGRAQARPAVITLLDFGRRLLWERRVEDPTARDLLAAETRRAIAELYEAAAAG
jgi:hypothetical protein